ncbi:MAG: hypothetical protein CME59_00410 [Halioglobus sp.]|nr:hypothetical protein [Halioglobus sp.]|tara:strand:+ start:2207 stop:2749 length:543 start_codon:yes stop_codon:yes gene_type:complete
MLDEPLPLALDIRKAATRGTGVSGVLKPAQLLRFRALLAGDEGRVEATLSCARDEQDRYIVCVVLEADVTVTCQRCLEAMPLHIASDNTLAVVWTDEQAAALPRHLDPLIVEETACKLHEVVEDELILAMPQFSYHDSAHCKEKISAYAGPAPEQEADAGKSNPFDVLAQLKAGDEHQES